MVQDFFFHPDRMVPCRNTCRPEQSDLDLDFVAVIDRFLEIACGALRKVSSVALNFTASLTYPNTRSAASAGRSAPRVIRRAASLVIPLSLSPSGEGRRNSRRRGSEDRSMRLFGGELYRRRVIGAPPG
jgi:hypothetical protein